MDKRGIIGVIAFTILLGVFFQFNRMDGLLQLDLFKKFNFSPSTVVNGTQVDATKDKFLIIYDPQDVYSVFANHRLTWLLEQQKKDVVSCPVNKDAEIDSEYRGVLVAASRWDKILSLPKIDSYAKQGGTVAFMMHPEWDDEGTVPDICQKMAGFELLGNAKTVLGLEMKTDFLFASKGFSLDEDTMYNTSAIPVNLQDNALVHMEALDGTPLLWEHPYGKGK